MNNPHPTQAQLRIERVADTLVTEQAAATSVYLAALRAFAVAFNAIDWPLGCPVAGYDNQSVQGTLADLLTVRHEFGTEAMDVAREKVMA